MLMRSHDQDNLVITTHNQEEEPASLRSTYGFRWSCSWPDSFELDEQLASHLDQPHYYYYFYFFVAVVRL